jgi:hypothetical protein
VITSVRRALLADVAVGAWQPAGLVRAQRSRELVVKVRGHARGVIASQERGDLTCFASCRGRGQGARTGCGFRGRVEQRGVGDCSSGTGRARPGPMSPRTGLRLRLRRGHGARLPGPAAGRHSLVRPLSPAPQPLHGSYHGRGRETLCAELSPYWARRRLRGGHARNEKRSATPVPLHCQLMPDTGACGKPRVMPHSHRP